MSQYHAKGLRKRTTGKRRPAHKKKRYELGGTWVETRLGEQAGKTKRTRGGARKKALYHAGFVNVRDPKENKVRKVKITGVLEHADNPHLVRRLVVTKGCIVETEIGKVRITSRPTQDGTVNGTLL